MPIYWQRFFGFRRAKSCYDCLSILRTEIALAKVNKELLGILSLDLQSAYDNVNVIKLMEILINKGIPKKILNFLVNLMVGRSLFGFFGGMELGRKSTNKGLPQGSILSPVLFNIYISDIIFKISYSCKLISFADDILVYCSDRNMDVILENLSFSAESINNWLEELNLSISVGKSKFMVLNYNKNSFLENEFQIEIGNNILKNCSSIRYLGMYIDSNLRWDLHVKFLKEKTRKIIGMFRTICKINKGMHPSIGVKVNKQFVRPALDWGGFLIQECFKKFSEKLDVIQNAAIRSSFGCLRTTPINVLLHLAGMNTLKSRRSILTKKFLTRQVAHRDSLLIHKLTLLSEKLSEKMA